MRRRMPAIQQALTRPHDIQHDLLFDFIRKSKNTEWGKQHEFSSVNSYSDFAARVPVSPYEKIFPYIDKMMKGGKDVLWPGQVTWYSKSSGTTNAKSKFIPVTPEALKECHYKGGKDILSFYFHYKPDSKLFDGKGLGIGGTYTEAADQYGTRCGDVSAVIMANLPFWAQYARTPSRKVALAGEWESKIEKIAAATMNKHVSNISGVPTWTVVLLEKMLEISGKKNILEIWPDFEAFFHGAVSFVPYREMFRKFFPSDHVSYVETYNASEGFFAMQDQPNSEDMLLLTNHGIFYEFIPMEEAESEHPKVLTLEQVELNKNYAMVITTNAGLWRYKIGDTIRFSSIKPYRIRVTGRTKHFINVYGEELIIENADTAIAKACHVTGAVMSDYTAGPVYFGEGHRGGHEWVIEFTKRPGDLQRFTEVLDQTLKELNSDYEAKRHKDMALCMPLIHTAPEGTFYNWLKRRGKLGGQHKVPRLANNREYIDDILKEIRS